MDGKVLVVGYYRWGEESSSCCVQIHSSFSVATIPQVIRYRVCSVWEGCVQDCWKCMFTTIIPPFLMRIFSLFIYGLQIQGLKCKSTRSAPCVDFVANAKGWVEDEFELESNHNNNSSNSTTQIQTNTHSEQQQSICIQTTRPHGCCRRIHYLLSASEWGIGLEKGNYIQIQNPIHQHFLNSFLFFFCVIYVPKIFGEGG